MLSILIPCYNYNFNPLVEEIHKQSSLCDINFEIIIVDDCSTKILYDRDKIQNLPNTQLTILKQNIGRSAIRNLLASKAKYENLLFIDAGTLPKSETFVIDYIEYLHTNLTIGGMAAEVTAPKKPYKLRWLYTKKRESCCENDKLKRRIFTSANFLIKKQIIKAHPFDENIKTYGFEDFIFFKNIEANGFEINFINNPVVHDFRETAHVFLKKTEESMFNLLKLKNSENPYVHDIRIIKWHSRIQKLRLNSLISLVLNSSKAILRRNFNSNYPSIILFDFYKLGFLCSITSKAK